MLPDPSEIIKDMLEALSAELGEPVNALWDVLIYQAWLEGVTRAVRTFGFIVLFALISFASFYLYTRGTREQKDSEGGAIVVAIWIFSTIMLLIFLTHSIFMIPSITTSILNPEYKALEMILEKINL